MAIKEKQQYAPTSQRNLQHETTEITPQSEDNLLTASPLNNFAPQQATTQLQRVSSPNARQAIFRSMQSRYGNQYAGQVARRYEAAKPATIQRAALLTAPEEQKALDAMQTAASGKKIDTDDLTNTGYFAIRPNIKISSSDSKEAKEWLYIRDKLVPKVVQTAPSNANNPENLIKYVKKNYPALYEIASLLVATPVEIVEWVANKLGLAFGDIADAADKSKKPSSGGGDTPAPEKPKPEDPATLTDWRAYLPRVKRGGKISAPFLPKPEPLPKEKGKKKKKAKKQPIVITDEMKALCEQIAKNRQDYAQSYFTKKKENEADTRREYKHARPNEKHIAKYKNWIGYSYGSAADSNSRAAEKKVQDKAKGVKATDGTLDTARYALWAEFATEGDANSINTFDGQGLTWGKGFAAGGKLGHVVAEFMKLVPGARAEFNAMGIDADASSGWLWVVDTDTCMQYGGAGGADVALNRINDKHPEIMANIAGFCVQQGEAHSEELVEAQMNVITGSIPKWAYDLPIHALQFIGHAVHWQSSALGWPKWDDVGSDMGELLKRFAYLLSANSKTSKYITKHEDAIIISEKQAVGFALGTKKGLGGNYKTWKTKTEAALGEITTTKPTSGYYIQVKGGYRKIG